MFVQDSRDTASTAATETRIMLFETDLQFRESAVIALGGLGRILICANTMLHVQRALVQHAFAVLILDLNQLSVSDMTFLESLHDLPASTMFVLTKAQGEKSELSDLLPPGFPWRNVVGVVEKPACIHDLVEVTQRALAISAERRAVHRPALEGPVLLMQGDEQRSAKLLAQLARLGLSGDRHVYHVPRLVDALSYAKLTEIQSGLVDIQLPDALGLDAVRRLRTLMPDMPLVVLAEPGCDIARQALCVGAQEVLSYEASDETVAMAIGQAVYRKSSDRKIQRSLNLDPLTGLLNRQRFMERVAQCVERVRRDKTACAVLYLDLDGFKPINDTLGHAAGDQVLRVIGSRLDEITRSCDAATRLGGDEFALLLEDVYDNRSVRLVAQRVLRAVATPVVLQPGNEVRVTASVGVAMCPQTAGLPDELLEAADAAMFESKRAGRSQYSIAAPIQQASLPPTPEARLRSELRDAVQRGEFYLVYQPQLELHSRSIVGMEALLRWRRPSGPKVGPDEFVPMLEQLELISGVGAFVLREACRHVQAWSSRRRRPVRVAVNVSPVQLEDPNFADLVLTVLREYTLESHQLELEVTEGTLMSGKRACETLQSLRARGIRIALDDFGTGYAALSYLREFPLDLIKIDRSFVAPMMSDSRARILVETIIDLARKLGMQVLAEGVETAEQLAHLRQYGCDACQGYLFGRPHFTGHLGNFLH